jgi:integrase
MNPFFGLPPTGREVRRDRVLSDVEVGAIWRAAAALNPIHRGFVRFLMFTLARRGEAARMTWSDVSADLTTWTQSGEARNGKAHIAPMP